MHSNAILHEVKQLYHVSDRLDSLAEQHPLVEEALITISGSVRNTATLLEVLVATKMGVPSGLAHRCLGASSVGLDAAASRGEQR